MNSNLLQKIYFLENAKKIRQLNNGRNENESITLYQYLTLIYRSSRPEVFFKKGCLRILVKFTGKHLCQSLFFNKVAGLSLFSCKFCEISKNTFCHRTPLVAASGFNHLKFIVQLILLSVSMFSKTTKFDSNFLI